jgi:hypothetical protein
MGHGKSPTQCEGATGVLRDAATGVLHNALIARRETAWEVFFRRDLSAAGAWKKRALTPGRIASGAIYEQDEAVGYP